MSFADDLVRVIIGGRHQVIQQYSYDYNTGDRTSGYNKASVTPVAGVAVKPAAQLLLYGNYIQGLTQGAVAPATVGGVLVSNSGEVFSPFRSVQYELGAKYDRSGVLSTLAVFRITQPSALLDGSIYRQAGKQ